MKKLNIIIPTVLITIVIIAIGLLSVAKIQIRLYSNGWSCYENGPCAEIGDWRRYQREQNIKAIAVEGNKIWVGTENGLVCMDKATGEMKHYRYPNSGLPDYHIKCIAIENSTKWIGTRYGLAKFDGVGWIIYTETEPKFPGAKTQTNRIKTLLPSDEINSIVVKNSTKWIATVCGLAKFCDTVWTVYNADNLGLASSRKRSSLDFFAIALEDSIIWGGTKKGLARLDGAKWTIYDKDNSGLPDNHVTAIAIEDSVKWIGTLGYGLAKFDGINWTVYNTKNSQLPNDWIKSIAIEDSIKWIGTHSRLVKFDGINWTLYNEKNSKLPSNHINVIVVDGSTKWIGTRAGLARFDGAKWTVYNTSSLGWFYRFICYNKMKKSKKYEDKMNRLSEKYGRLKN
ncbi:MAG: hypothetical protein WC614_13805 [bacterium]